MFGAIESNKNTIGRGISSSVNALALYEPKNEANRIAMDRLE